MNYRIAGFTLLIVMIVMNLLRSLTDMKLPYALTITTGVLGLAALGVDSYRRNRLRNFVFRISVFLVALAAAAAIQYIAVS